MLSISKNVDLCFETLYVNSEWCIKTIHDVLGFVVGTQNFSINLNLFGYHSRMSLHNVESIINGFNAFDLCKFRIDVGLNIWAHQFENFVQKRTTIQLIEISSCEFQSPLALQEREAA
jgi:hypothetical protein